MTRILSWVVLFAPFAVSLVSGHGPPRKSASDLLGADRIATFERLQRQIEAHRHLSDMGLKRLNTNWKSELAKAQDRFEKAKTSDDVYYALRSLANSPHDYHSDLERIPPFLEPRGLPLKIHGLQLRPSYPNGAEEGEGSEEAVEFYLVEPIADVPAGSVLDSVDDVPVKLLRRAYYQWFSGGSSPFRLNEFFAGWLSYRDPKVGPSPKRETQTYTFLQDGARRDLQLTWVKVRRPPRSAPYCTPCEAIEDYQDSAYQLRFKGLNYCIFTTTTLPKISIVHVLSFYYPDGDPAHACMAGKLADSDLPKENTPLSWRALDHDALPTQLRKLQAEGAKAVVFDLRRTGGGLFHPDLVSHFASKPYRITTKSFYYSPAFSDPDDDWVLLNQWQPSLYVGPTPSPPASPIGPQRRNEPNPNDCGPRNLVPQLRRYKRKNPTEFYSNPLPFFCRPQREDDPAYAGTSDPIGPVGAVLGPHCGSACDQFASILVDNGIAVPVGLPTAGGSSPYRIAIPLRLADDSEVRLRVTVGVDYRPIEGEHTLEGNPVRPDKLLTPVQESPSEYLARALRRLYVEMKL